MLSQRKLNVICCQERETKFEATLGLSGVCDKIGHPTVRGSLDPIALQGIFVGWNRRVPPGIKIATFRDDGEVEEVFTSTTMRYRDTVFPWFGDAEAELQEFGESARVRSDEVEGPSLALRRPDVEPEGAEGNPARGEEMQDDKGREQPDPEELRRRAAEACADTAGARPTMMGGAGPPVRSHCSESQ